MADTLSSVSPRGNLVSGKLDLNCVRLLAVGRRAHLQLFTFPISKTLSTSFLLFALTSSVSSLSICEQDTERQSVPSRGEESHQMAGRTSANKGGSCIG